MTVYVVAWQTKLGKTTVGGVFTTFDRAKSFSKTKPPSATHAIIATRPVTGAYS